MASRDTDGKSAPREYGTERLPLAQSVIAGCVVHVSGGSASDRGRSLALTAGEVVIGNDPSCNLVLEDGSVSRRHLRLTVTPEGILAEDLGSTNGTHYLGQRIERVLLRRAAQLTIGRVALDILPPSTDQGIKASVEQHYGKLIGATMPMRQLFGTLELIEKSDAPVLIRGETGTGKEVAAAEIHQHSRRAGEPFIIIDCGNMSADLMSSELFGHKKGSFTGATVDRVGAFEAADRGTVFLDEIGELPLELQPKLLRVLETGEVKPLGEVRHHRVDVRVIAATSRDLGEAVRTGAFREDLYYRLSVVAVELPPLRERLDDIPVLVNHFIQQLGGDPAQRVSLAAEGVLLHYAWPGNVRQLRNAVQRILALGESGLVDLLRSPRGQAGTGGGRPGASGAGLAFRDAREAAIAEFEKAYLRGVLDEASGNLSEAARTAGIDRKYFRQLLRKHGLYTDGDDE